MRPFPGPPVVPGGPEHRLQRLLFLRNAYDVSMVVILILVCTTMLRGFCRCSSCEAQRRAKYPNIAADDWHSFESHSAKTLAYDTSYRHHKVAREQFVAGSSWVPCHGDQPEAPVPTAPAPASRTAPASSRGELFHPAPPEPMEVDSDAQGGGSGITGSPGPPPFHAQQTAQQHRHSRLPGNDGAIRRPREAALPNLSGLSPENRGWLNWHCTSELINKLENHETQGAVAGHLQSLKGSGAVSMAVGSTADGSV